MHNILNGFTMRSLVLIYTFTNFIYWGDAKPLKVYFNVTDEEYDNMPTLFHLENFDICMNLKAPTLYCYTTIQLHPLNNHSKIWNIIEEVISAPRTYRHDRIRRGICIPKTCPSIPPMYYKNGNGTEEIWKGISKLYNNKYMKFGLSGRVIEMNCEDTNLLYEVDYVDLLYASILGMLVSLVIAGTMYEGLSRKLPLEVYEFRTKRLLYGKILSSFSLITNWEKMQRVNTAEDARAMYPIQGVRVYNTYFVIFSHTVMVIMAGPVYNERFVEDSTLKVENMFVSNGSLICQTFFLISGFVLSYTLCVMFKNKKVKVSDLAFAFIYRFFRLTPMLLLAIGFSATWFRHLTHGPVWEHLYINDFKNCRKHWWVNVLFLNNIYKANEMCLQQTWYLAVDMQLFIVGLVVMFLVINNQERAKIIFGLFTIIPLILSVAHNYYLDVDIVFRSYSETVYTYYLQYQQWTEVFVASHFAIPTYIHGLTCGYYFYKLREEKRVFIANKSLKIVHHISIWTMPILIVLLAGQFYKEGYEHNRMNAALYQGLNRYIFGFPIGLFLLGATTGVGGPMVTVTSWAPLQVLAKIQFSLFLVHIWPIRLRYGSLRSPTYITNLKIFSESIADSCISILLGTVIYLILEMPLSSLQRIFMKTDDRSKEKSQ